MYFNSFPPLKYTVDNGQSYQYIKDIFRRTLLTYSAQTKSSYFNLYNVQEGETPEIVADKFYRDPKAHWIILQANEILDPRFDWVMSNQNLISYVENKYGASNIYAIHHYEWIINAGTSAERVLISSIPDSNFTTSVSNFEYESALNESKRRIKVIVPELVPALKASFKTLIVQ